MSTISIAIVDDHFLLSIGIKTIIEENEKMSIHGIYHNGSSLLKSLNHHSPDIILLDINMPDLKGDEVAKSIKAKYPEIKIIALTSYDNVYHIKNMLKQNIDGYLLKSIQTSDLIDAIQIVYNGGKFLDKNVEDILNENEKLEKKQKVTGAVLTKRELEVLELISKSYTSGEIAETLFISKRTVEHHRESIYQKLKVQKVSDLIHQARNMGIIL